VIATGLGQGNGDNDRGEDDTRFIPVMVVFIVFGGVLRPRNPWATIGTRGFQDC